MFLAGNEPKFAFYPKKQLTDNKDDHTKKFSFICRNGKWSLSPAYDLTRSTEGYNGEHATSVNNNELPTVEDMLAVVETIRIGRKKGMEIIESMITICREILAGRFEFCRGSKLS